jgi:hypothetical protein
VGNAWVWLTLFALGCYHGVNPAMGWLFAVALGLQERSTRAVLKAIVPIAIGHIASIAIVVALAVAAQWIVPQHSVHLAAGTLLCAFGIFRLVRVRHPRWVGMRVGFGRLTLWGFLMSSAHGAGLMLIPFVTMPAFHAAAPMAGMPMPAAPAGPSPGIGVLMIIVHTAGYLLVMTFVALLVYRKFGLSFLRTAWFNVDLVWATALIVAGIVAFVT